MDNNMKASYPEILNEVLAALEAQNLQALERHLSMHSLLIASLVAARAQTSLLDDCSARIMYTIDVYRNALVQLENAFDLATTRRANKLLAPKGPLSPYDGSGHE